MVQVGPRSCNQGRRKNDAFYFSATLRTNIEHSYSYKLRELIASQVQTNMKNTVGGGLHYSTPNNARAAIVFLTTLWLQKKARRYGNA